MIFIQQNGLYKQPATVTINNNQYNGEWVIRQTHTSKLWVVEFIPGAEWMLCAQTLYSTPESAAQVAANAIRLGVIHKSGKWYPDRSLGPEQPTPFELFDEPISEINWA